MPVQSHLSQGFAIILSTIVVLAILGIGRTAYSSPATLPGIVATAAEVASLRAGEIRMYKQCVSKGTNCNYTNACMPGADGSGCANTDACTSCSGGTNAGCTGNLGSTKCIDDTLRCCSLSKACELRAAGCTCTQGIGLTGVGDIEFCSGS